MLNSLKLAIGVGVLLAASQAGAATVGFSDRASFLAASGEATNHANPPVSKRTGPATIGGLVITPETSNFFSINNSVSGITNALVFSDRSGENFDVAINDDVFGFGFDIFEPNIVSGGCGVTCVASTFQITLFNNATVIGSETFTPTPSSSVADFFGITSTTAFNGVTIRETVGTNDNEHFGNFTTVVAAVPLPAPFALLLASLAGLVFLKRRQTA